MILDRIWALFVLLAVLAGIVQVVAGHQGNVPGEMVDALFGAARTGFEISLGLTGVMALWLGFMRLGEKGGAVDGIARIFGSFPPSRRAIPPPAPSS